MGGGWCRFCELEESYIKDVKRSHYLPARHLDASLVLFGSIRETQKEIRGAGCKVLDSNLCTPVSRSREQQIKGKMLQFGWMQFFCGGHSDCCVSRWSVTKWAITPVGLAIYYWYESQTTRRRQWFMPKHFNPNWYFDNLWPMLHKILQSILILYSFAKAVFLIGSILSVSFWQLWEFLNNWWRPWVTEFLGMGAWTKKAWFVVSAPSGQQGSKMAK